MIQIHSTFCYDRDYPNRHEWLGGHFMALASQTIVPVETPQTEDTEMISVTVKTRSHDAPDEFWFNPSWHRGRGRKPMTLRSWRNPRALGGSCRKATAEKLIRRLPVIPLFFAFYRSNPRLTV